MYLSNCARLKNPTALFLGNPEGLKKHVKYRHDQKVWARRMICKLRDCKLKEGKRWKDRVYSSGSWRPGSRFRRSIYQNRGFTEVNLNWSKPPGPIFNKVLNCKKELANRINQGRRAKQMLKACSGVREKWPELRTRFTTRGEEMRMRGFIQGRKGWALEQNSLKKIYRSSNLQEISSKLMPRRIS